MNFEISATQKQIDNGYMEIGKQVFSQEKDNPDSPVAERCRNIIEEQQAISDLDAKIQQIKTDVQTNATSSAAPLKKVCINCGTEVVGGSKFCPSCGTPMNLLKTLNFRLMLLTYILSTMSFQLYYCPAWRWMWKSNDKMSKALYGMNLAPD